MFALRSSQCCLAPRDRHVPPTTSDNAPIARSVTGSPLDHLQAALSGRYEIERELGRGGMATVYLARDLRHDRHAALKLLSADLSAVLGAERCAGVNAWRTSAIAIPRPARFVIEPPGGLPIYDRMIDIPFALSPDGQAVVFVAGTDGDLYLRRRPASARNSGSRATAAT